jgi:3-methyladenine DNA glycosylase AlkD
MEAQRQAQYHSTAGLSLNMDARQEAEQLKSQLKQNANPRRAAGEKAYLKSPQQFYGVDVPTLRKLARTWVKANKKASMDEVAELVVQLWDSDWHEERSLAIQLLEYRSADLTLKHMPLIEKMIGEAVGWAHLDAIATTVVGALIDNDPATLEYLPHWAESDNFWVRRAAVLAQNIQFRRGEGDFDLFTKLTVPMFNEVKDWSKEERFFIRKAIGWSLRELVPARPDLVFDFVRQYQNQMSGLTFREATRKLPEEMRAKLG